VVKFARRATVGGWIARDGMGVGSFAYGWLRENVLSAEMILPDGRPRTLEGDDLGLAVGAMGRTGVIVRATLGVRQTKGDRPFAAAFERPEALQTAISSLLERRPPLWHLGFVNPPMSRAMRAREEYLIFGAYAASDAGAAESQLERTFGVARGRTVEPAEAYRMWGSWFFPVSSAEPYPPLVGYSYRLRGSRPSSIASGGIPRSWRCWGPLAARARRLCSLSRPLLPRASPWACLPRAKPVWWAWRAASVETPTTRS
jgi:hypothetical protein